MEVITFDNAELEKMSTLVFTLFKEAGYRPIEMHTMLELIVGISQATEHIQGLRKPEDGDS